LFFHLAPPLRHPPHPGIVGLFFESQDPGLGVGGTLGCSAWPPFSPAAHAQPAAWGAAVVLVIGEIMLAIEISSSRASDWRDTGLLLLFGSIPGAGPGQSPGECGRAGSRLSLRPPDRAAFHADPRTRTSAKSASWIREKTICAPGP
jgi:hypothetical protein